MPAVPFKTGQLAVTATAQKLSSDEAPIETLIIKGVDTNSVTVYVGNSSAVTTATGYPIQATEEFVFSPANGPLGRTPRPNEVWLIAGSTGSTVAWIATPR
jgi:hypothetical protein